MNIEHGEREEPLAAAVSKSLNGVRVPTVWWRIGGIGGEVGLYRENRRVPAGGIWFGGRKQHLAIIGILQRTEKAEEGDQR